MRTSCRVIAVPHRVIAIPMSSCRVIVSFNKTTPQAIANSGTRKVTVDDAMGPALASKRKNNRKAIAVQTTANEIALNQAVVEGFTAGQKSMPGKISMVELAAMLPTVISRADK